MLLHHRELPHDLLAFLVVGHILSTRHIADIDGNIPCKCRTASLSPMLTRPQCRGQAVATAFAIRADVGIAKSP